jgi:hypothetical protein
MSDMTKVERLSKLMALAAAQSEQASAKVTPPCTCCGQPSWNGSGISATASTPAEARLLIARFNAMKAIAPVCKSCFFDPGAIAKALDTLVNQ